MKQPQKGLRRGLMIYVIFLVVMVGGSFLLQKYLNNTTAVSYTDYLQYLKDGKITDARITQNEAVPTGRIRFLLKDDETVYSLYVPDVKSELNMLLTKGVDTLLDDVPAKSIFTTVVLPILVMLVGCVIIFIIMSGRMGMAGGGGGGGNPMAGFTKSRAQMSDPKNNDIKFKDVAGLLEEKEDLVEIVDFLSHPQKYIDLGARIPKGVLLVGPPGTGKTLLAKAVAGEAGVPFFTISGSDFVEMFVGVGASRVRDLFNDAKKNAPCIVFIDEIDAVARIRGSGLGGGHDEREQTLNQLLVEMDGFSVNQGIIVMAATNRADILDPAILRPGRFDRKISVGRPDVRGRQEILEVHSRNKRLGDDVNLKTVAQTTAGFSGADLENLMNEAAINAAKEDRRFIDQTDIEKAFIKVGIGTEKRSRIISEKEKKITAYHEMGHAILFEALPDVGPVHTISIIPTGIGAAGYTMPLPEQDEMYDTKNTMLQDIMVAMGGRIAEEIVFNDVTTGASQDIRQATEIARNMVMKYGMSDKIGFINYEQSQDEVFMGRDLGHMKTYGQEVYNEIEAEVRRIIDECYTQAKDILMSKRDVLDKGAALLLEKEKLGREEFEAIYHDTDRPQCTVH